MNDADFVIVPNVIRIISNDSSTIIRRYQLRKRNPSPIVQRQQRIISPMVPGLRTENNNGSNKSTSSSLKS